MRYNLITILGPTAVGKTFLGASLAYRFGGEIISADSRQVYKGMDLGTGKDLKDYTINGRNVPYHLIDIVDPRDEFNLYLFGRSFYETFIDISSRSKIPFLVGGTGLYIHSILKGYDLKMVEFNEQRYSELNQLDMEELREILKGLSPSLHNTTDLLIKERIIRGIMVADKNGQGESIEKLEINPLVLGVKLEREQIKKRITVRLKQRLAGGMIDEVKRLMEEGITIERMEIFGLEYKYVSKFISGELNYNDMFQKLNSSIHGFAKRQMTWFRKMEKEGIEIHWIEGPDYNSAEQIISEYYFS
ncbi:MAG: tRNA (adenosine(37)-N6)-dimethylallyltransferase MiaA [Ignavibacteriae bacterium HGW-Ignavibacteriae-3]|nr:MAG: tRNA (adenosine(37)-N6)-dimethylallyltransferase MiaA [Ignavibacteriae bacterium HGW-Ignavibacteriae-3]